MFNIVVEDPDDPQGKGPNGGKLYVWQNSWGLSTRTIGVMVMIHGDNQGLVIPPRVASLQVIVVPCGLKTSKQEDTAAQKDKANIEKEDLYARCEELAQRLRKAGIRAKADIREGYTPGYKFNDWEQKASPILTDTYRLHY